MILRLLLWNLADSQTNLDEIREHLDDEEGAIPGLRLRAWVSDEATDRFGAVELWESRTAADRPVPSRIVDLLGKGPDVGEDFDVELTA